MDQFAELNANEEVMEHFPAPLTRQETADFIERLQDHYEKYGHNYFAVEILESGDFIGFIGVVHQTYETEFTPAVDIGWRLKPSSWGKEFATEGAKRCVKFAFEDLKLDRIIATCTIDNKGSEQVMKKIGMTFGGEFKHPRLKERPEYEDCIWYELKSDFERL